MPSPRLLRFELHPLRVISEGGIVQGILSAVGVAARKRASQKRERASAIPRDMPSPNKEIVLHGYEDKKPN